MHLKSILKKSNHISPFAKAMNRLSEPSTEKTLAEITIQLDKYTPREPNKYEQITAYNIATEAHNGIISWKNMPKWVLRAIPWILFNKTIDGEQVSVLIDLPDFLDNYIESLSQKNYIRGIKGFYHFFMLEYPFEKAGFNLASNKLLNLIKNSQHERIDTIKNIVTKYRLLDPDAALLCANYIERTPNLTLNQFLLSCGLTGELNTGNFSGLCYKHYINKISQSLYTLENESKTIELIDLMINESIETNESNEKNIKFKHHSSALIESMMQPYVEKGIHKSVKEKIKSFILEYYSDPRIDRKNWISVPESVKELFIRWMTESTLENFFTLLDRSTESNPTAAEQWRYRKQFWTSYLARGEINEAWLVLGRTPQAESDRFLPKGTLFGKATKSFASHQSAIMLKIGSLVITEFSDNGKFRVWLSNNNEKPNFYLDYYIKEELMQYADFEGSHAGKERGTWQQQLSDYIENETGIKNTYIEYMPKR